MKSSFKSNIIFTFIVSLIFILLLYRSTPAQANMNKNQNIEIYDLRCEGLKNPLGIDVENPQVKLEN